MRNKKKSPLKKQEPEVNFQFTIPSEGANEQSKPRVKSKPAREKRQIKTPANQPPSPALTREEKRDKREEKRNNRKIGKDLKKIIEVHPIKSWGGTEQENFIRNTTGFFEVYRLKGRNLFGMKQEAFIRLMEAYGALSSLYEPPLKIVSINSPVDTSAQQAYYKREYQRATSPRLKKLLERKYSELAFIGKYRQMEEYFIFVFGYSEEKLRENVSTFHSCLSNSIEVESLSKEDKVQLLFRMSNPSMNQAPNPPRGLVVKNKRILEEAIDVELLARIQPQGNLKFGETYVRTGTGYSATLTTFRLQSEPDYLWLNSYTKINDKILSVDIATQDDDNLRAAIGQALNELSNTYHTSKDATSREIAYDDHQALLRLSKQVRKGREILKFIIIRTKLFADTLEELEKRVIDVRKELKKDEFGVTNATLEQGYEWQAMFLDYHSQLMLPNGHSGLDISSTVFGASFPANQVFLTDPRGQYIGLSNTGGQMIVDFFEISGGRTFYNILLTGLMGRGKTTLMKKIMLDNVGRGYMVRGFDKSGEFSKLIKSLDGTILRLDGQDGRLNIFEVFPLAVNEDTLQIDEKACMIFHQSKLGTWYSILKPKAPEEELDIFDKMVSRLYIQKGFKDAFGDVKQVTGRAPNDYPILSDLIALIEEAMKATQIKVEEEHLYNIYTTLTKLIETTQDMFNGPTNVPDLSNQQILFFNIDGLSSYDKRYVNAQLFNAFNFFQSSLFINGRRENKRYQEGEISFEEIKRGMFFMAEAHNLLNARNPRMVEYFNTFAREARKRFCGLCLDTQTVRSLVSRKDTGAEDDEMNDIYDFMQYRFFFQPGDEELKNLRQANDGSLTDTEVEKISKFQPKQTLLKITSGETYEMRVFASEEELALFDGGGKRSDDIA